MKIVAVMACRNEAEFLPTCLRHLIANGVDFAIVDNGSSDESMDIVHSTEFRNHLVAIKKVPYEGVFRLKPLLEAKVALAENTDADWVMNICPDEILHPNRKNSTLLEEVEFFDKAGFNVINFDEFVFLPVTQPLEVGLHGWPMEKRHYFFEPSRIRQMRLWKNHQGFSMIRHGGHRLDGEKLRLSPESFVLRHYIFLSQEHAYHKYPNRKFSEQELARGWHRNRHGIKQSKYKFPDSNTLETLSKAESFAFNRSYPRLKHYWEDEE